MNCYVLIGGRSRRMGRSKIDLPFAGTTLFGHVVAAARQAFERVIAVQRPDGEPQRGVDTIFEEPHEGAAPIYGVLRALQHARERCFVLAVDYPLVTADLLRYVRSRFEESSASVVLPVWGGKPQVLCAGWSPELVPRLEEGITAGELSLQVLLGGAALLIPEGDLRSRFSGDPLMNVNTPDDLQEAKRLYDQQGLLTPR